MDLQTLTIVLGSSVVGGLLTSIFTKLNSDKANTLKHITEERKSWRETIRKISEEIIKLSSKEQATIVLANMITRLNPDDEEDQKIIDQLKVLISDPTNEDVKYEVLNRISWLLKHDWERAKLEAKPWLRLYHLIPLSLFGLIITYFSLSFTAFSSYEFIYFLIERSLIASLAATIIFFIIKVIDKKLINKYSRYRVLRNKLFKTLKIPYRQML
ncbi:hypothetical protein [Brevibacillus choshinensis]|uniref:hypothetical protein n=1 Tax=Brevibacillus choshinensis TaxID=54911 RepID=UPI002E223BF0|nr:hypothetical protein [Brevibacillus choshinensis]